LADYISVRTKSYRAEFVFGVTTDSYDAEGRVTARSDAAGLTAETVSAALRQFTGTIAQRPPLHSAVQVGGRRAYSLVRNGETVELPLREVTVMAFDALRFTPGVRPRLLADITCSKGTYIRSLARDLGEAVGTGATMSFLARTRVGTASLETSITLDELRAAAEAGQFDACLQSADTPLAHIPAYTLRTEDQGYYYGAGAAVSLAPDLYRVYADARFIGLGRCEEGILRMTVNLL
jgi:tRNA pseudouridine55 synthase